MLLLVDLPDVVLKHLQSFLSYDDTRSFMNSNKSHFSSLKQGTIYFSLNNKKSREYVEDERFREMILSKIKDGSKQIGLNFYSALNLPDIRDIIVQKIDFGNCGFHFESSTSYPHLLKNVPSQSYFLPTGVKQIPFLPVLQDLKLYCCKNIQDFSSLSHLKKLQLSDTSQLTDLTPLQNIPHLTFINCRNLRDFSALSCERQTFLSLSYSPISNVSPLYGIKNLSLEYCSHIQNISGLGSHHRLRIFCCGSIKRGFECFKSIRHAEVQFNVADLSFFRELKSLIITISSSMKNQLFFLKDIPNLELVPSSPEGLKGVYDISDVRNIRLSFYDDILKINETNFPSQLLYLQLHNCDQIVKIINRGKTSIFCNLQSLQITDCSIKHVKGLGDIPNIILHSCPNLHDIRGLGRNRYVELEDCPEIRDVSSLVTVPSVMIKECDGILDYTCLSSVPRLKIVVNRIIRESKIEH